MTTPSPGVNFDREYSVFLNCPFGSEFRDIRHALTLAVLASGHIPICDFDGFDLNPVQPDLTLLAEGMFKSKYSIHDCTRCCGERPDALGRFNIPIELGMALGERVRTVSDNSFHEILILCQKDHSYSHFLRTLNGVCLDFSGHIEAMTKVFNWLTQKKTCSLRPKTPDLVDVWYKFEKNRPSGESIAGGFGDLAQNELREYLLSLCKEQNWWTEPTWQKFDVFLAHNSNDKPQVELIAERLKERRLKPWLDKEQIPPGRSFHDQIQAAIPHCKSAAIFFGPHGLGNWQSQELQVFMGRAVEADIPIIPVLLPDCQDNTRLPAFVSTFQWVDFRNNTSDALDALIWGITGKRQP